MKDPIENWKSIVKSMAKIAKGLILFFDESIAEKRGIEILGVKLLNISSDGKKTGKH